MEEMAKAERAMECRRCLPDAIRPYCLACLTRFPTGVHLSPVDLLQYDEETRRRLKVEPSQEEIEAELKLLSEEVTGDEDEGRKALMIISAFDEAELALDDESLPVEIIYCGVCGNRFCRRCAELVQRSSAFSCPTCVSTVVVPTLSTLRQFT